jgi:hypothetical protein
VTSPADKTQQEGEKEVTKPGGEELGERPDEVIPALAPELRGRKDREKVRSANHVPSLIRGSSQNVPRPRCPPSQGLKRPSGLEDSQTHARMGKGDFKAQIQFQRPHCSDSQPTFYSSSPTKLKNAHLLQSPHFHPVHCYLYSCLHVQIQFAGTRHRILQRREWPKER